MLDCEACRLDSFVVMNIKYKTFASAVWQGYSIGVLSKFSDVYTCIHFRNLVDPARCPYSCTTVYRVHGSVLPSEVRPRSRVQPNVVQGRRATKGYLSDADCYNFVNI